MTLKNYISIVIEIFFGTKNRKFFIFYDALHFQSFSPPRRRMSRMFSIHCNLMKNSFQLFLSYLSNTRFYSERECLCICSHNRLEVQLNAVVSRFPLELTFPVGLWAYSIFENVMGEPKAQLANSIYLLRWTDKCPSYTSFHPPDGSNRANVKNKIFLALSHTLTGI